jgi:hypothetical protein
VYADLRQDSAGHAYRRKCEATAVEVSVYKPQNDDRNNRSKNAFHNWQRLGTGVDFNMVSTHCENQIGYRR